MTLMQRIVDTPIARRTYETPMWRFAVPAVVGVLVVLVALCT